MSYKCSKDDFVVVINMFCNNTVYVFYIFSNKFCIGMLSIIFDGILSDYLVYASRIQMCREFEVLIYIQRNLRKPI